MQGKQMEALPDLHVPGFTTLGHSGRYIILECHGGNARNAVHAVRDYMKKHDGGEWRGIIIRGLSRRYDLQYELIRMASTRHPGRKATNIRFSCWKSARPPSGPQPAVCTEAEQPETASRQRKQHQPIYEATGVPGIRVTKLHHFRLKVGSRYVGTYATLGDAVMAKLNYVSSHERHGGVKASSGDLDIDNALGLSKSPLSKLPYPHRL